jgi:4-amino-4-deoxy-L-arabinose transferase-like glycosyltransferase
MTNGRGLSLRTFAISILLLTVFLRIPALVHPRAIDDEGVYSLVGNQIAEGGRPYVDAVERKPPLLFWTYAAIIKMGGEYNWPFLHAAALLWVIATMAGLYVIGRGLFDPLTGLFAALLYSLYQPWLKFIDLAFNGEVVMNLPIVLGWAIAFSKSRSRVRPELLVCGMLLCASFLLKQPAAIAAIPLGLYFLLPSYQKSRGITFSTGVFQAAVFTAGFFGTLALTSLILWKQGILRETIFWTITNHTVAHIFWTKGFLHTLLFIGVCLPLVLGSVISYRNRAGLWATHSAERTTLAGFVIVSAIGAAAGGRFYPHYYIQLIPPLAILAASVFAHVFSTSNNRPLWLRPSVVTAALVITFVGFSISYWVGEMPRRKATEAAEYLRTHSKPDDRIFVWGQDADIYLDAQRRPACPYVVTFPLTGLIFGGIHNIDTSDRIVPGTWDNLDQAFKAHPPVYIIDINEDPKNAQYPILHFPVLARWLQSYKPVATVREGIIYQAKDATNSPAPAQ